MTQDRTLTTPTVTFPPGPAHYGLVEKSGLNMSPQLWTGKCLYLRSLKVPATQIDSSQCLTRQVSEALYEDTKML